MPLDYNIPMSGKVPKMPNFLGMIQQAENIKSTRQDRASRRKKEQMIETAQTEGKRKEKVLSDLYQETGGDYGQMGQRLAGMPGMLDYSLKFTDLSNKQSKLEDEKSDRDLKIVSSVGKQFLSMSEIERDNEMPDFVRYLQRQGVEIPEHWADSDIPTIEDDIRMAIAQSGLGEDLYKTEKSKLEVDKVKAEIEKIKAQTNEVAGSPGSPSEKTVKIEQQLRKEFVKNSQQYVDQRDAIGRIKAVGRSATAAGDLALVFNYMKLLDPGSVVRESEFKTAEQAKSWLSKSEEGGVIIPSSVKTAIQKADPNKSGAFLLPAQRNDFLNQADKIFKKSDGQHSKRKGEYKRIIDQYPGVKSNRVLIDLTPVSDEQQGWTISKQNRLEELRKKKAEGTLK